VDVFLRPIALSLSAASAASARASGVCSLFLARHVRLVMGEQCLDIALAFDQLQM